jgi:hypothetical protein
MSVGFLQTQTEFSSAPFGAAMLWVALPRGVEGQD